MPPPSPPPPGAPPPYFGCRLIHGVGDCREANNCSGHGDCVFGRCACHPFWTGVNCSAELLCNYWDEAQGIWSSEGLVASPPPGGVSDGFLYCESTHLTEFGGVIQIPLSAEELLEELSNIQFNVFTLDDMASALSDFDIVGTHGHLTTLRWRLWPAALAPAVSGAQSSDVRRSRY